MSPDGVSGSENVERYALRISSLRKPQITVATLLSEVDTRKAKEQLGWQPAVSLDEGLWNTFAPGTSGAWE